MEVTFVPDANWSKHQTPGRN